MKRLLCVVVALTFLAACAKEKAIDGVTYKPYGLLTADNDKAPGIKYEVVWGNVFWGIIFSETFLVPGYFICFSIFEPVGKKDEPKGAVST